MAYAKSNHLVHLYYSLFVHVPGITKSRRKVKRGQTKREKFIFVTLPAQLPGRWNSSGQTLNRFVDSHMYVVFFFFFFYLCVCECIVISSLFWLRCPFEQVVEIKLQFEIYEKRLKALSLQKASAKGIVHSQKIIWFWFNAKLCCCN